jgi:hypothetical protein
MAVVLGGWIALRVYALWPMAEAPILSPARPRGYDVARVAVPASTVAALPAPAGGSAQTHDRSPPMVVRPAAVAAMALRHDPPPVAPQRTPDPVPPPAAVRSRMAAAADDTAVVLSAPDVRRGTVTASRWSASLWAIARPGDADAVAVATPQLGGSQAGVRLAHVLDPARRVAVYGRIAAALGTRQQEAAVGVEWRPLRGVAIVAERRVALAGTRGGGAALGIVAGVAQTLPLRFRLDGYAQAGVIARDGGEGYGDGALRLARRVAGVDLGLGAWGAAQRGAARLDVGPGASLALPGALRNVRLAIDWRHRLAGQAVPASGPTLSLGADF